MEPSTTEVRREIINWNLPIIFPHVTVTIFGPCTMDGCEGVISLNTTTMAGAGCPLEVIHKFITYLDLDYDTQSSICLVSRPLCNFTQPRLYRSFSSLLVKNSDAHAAYLYSIHKNPRLAKLVHDYTFITERTAPWPRDLYITLPAMSNLKDLTLINRFQTDHPNHLDLWRYFFQSDKVPFQLTSLRLFWVGPEKGRIFESMMLCSFLRGQKSLENLILYYHTALISENDLPNVKDVTVDWGNFNYVVPGRPIQTLQIDGTMANAMEYLKPIAAGSPMDTTLRNLKVLRVSAPVVAILSPNLSSLEVLVTTKYMVTPRITHVFF